MCSQSVFCPCSPHCCHAAPMNSWRELSPLIGSPRSEYFFAFFCSSATVYPLLFVQYVSPIFVIIVANVTLYVPYFSLSCATTAATVTLYSLCRIFHLFVPLLLPLSPFCAVFFSYLWHYCWYCHPLVRYFCLICAITAAIVALLCRIFLLFVPLLLPLSPFCAVFLPNLYHYCCHFCALVVPFVVVFARFCP